LGNRSIRYLLRNPPIFAAQLRRLARERAWKRPADVSQCVDDRGTACGKPRATSVQGLPAFEKHIPFNEAIKCGVMIENTSCGAAIADRVGAGIDFLVIGTNDLIQYTLAVDLHQ
jgi:phosphoenolpyruvate-protein kinase (PTS system EI component)